MKKILLFLLLAMPGVCRGASYYDLQQQSVIKSTTNYNNDWYYRGNFHLGASTYTVNAASMPQYTHLYATGTVVTQTGIIQGSNFSVGGSTFVVTDGKVGIGTGSSPPTGQLHIKSAASSQPHVQLENTNGDASMPQMTFYHNTTSPADNDSIGSIDMFGRNDNSQDVQYGAFDCHSLDVTDTTEDSDLVFYTYKDGAQVATLKMTSGDVWVPYDMSALTYTDRTPYPDSTAQAYSAVLSMSKKTSGGVDHENLDPYILKVSSQTTTDPITKIKTTKTEYGRNLSATVSCLNEVVKDLIMRLETLEAENYTIKQRLDKLEGK